MLSFQCKLDMGAQQLLRNIFCILITDKQTQLAANYQQISTIARKLQLVTTQLFLLNKLRI